MDIRAYIRSIITDKNKTPFVSVIKIILACFSLLYLSLIKTVVFLYDKNILKKIKPSIKVISIGNITWGGTGKTPLVELIARYLKDKGRKVAIISRGYKSVTSHKLQVTSYEHMGDEAFMLSRNLKDVSIIVSPDRIKGINEATKKYNADTIILDDGFQQWKIAKDLDIVTIDTAYPFGNGWLLPRGILREPITSLKRADILFLTKARTSYIQLEEIKSVLKSINPQALIVESVYNPKYLVNLKDREVLPVSYLNMKEVCIFSGIARPSSFKDIIKDLGYNIKLVFEFPDHYAYKKKDLDNIYNECRENQVKAIVTTEKDAVRFESLFKEYNGDIRIFYLSVETDILGQKESFYGRLSSIY